VTPPENFRAQGVRVPPIRESLGRVGTSGFWYYMSTFEGDFRLFLSLLNSLSAFEEGSSD
jgi:hypothetical protein